LLATHERGRRLQSGARVVLAGAPNAGKSSLFNALLGRERAIVSPHPGTTRDTIEASIDLSGIPLTLVDTAGLRDAPEEIEAVGIARTRAELDGADLILFLVDPADDPKVSWGEYATVAGRPHFLIYTKADRTLTAPRDPGQAIPAVAELHLSTRSPESVQALEDAIIAYLKVKPSEGGDGTILAAERHAEGIRAALVSLQQAFHALAQGASLEFIVVDLAECLSRIDAITGEGELDEAILDVIFSTFCLGK
jgi:tRNA modification GTPase